MQQDISGMKILSVDDNQDNLNSIEILTESLDLETTSFLSPIDAIEDFQKFEDKYDLIIVDFMMPKLNGIEFIKKIRLLDKDIPIIMVTAAGQDNQLHLDSLESGANDFLSKPIDYPSFCARLTNNLLLRKSHLLLKNQSKLLEYEIKLATKTIIDREHETLKILAQASIYKDSETGAHIERVAHYCKLLSKLNGENEKYQDTIFYASPFHDIGKLSIPDSILLKPGKFNDNEYEIMKTHAIAGYNLLKNSQSEYLKEGSIIALTHHEKYDGSGYPNNLKGEDIPLSGRITAVADVFDALTTERYYKKAWSFEEAIKFLIEEKNKHFDPKLIDLFVNNVDLFKEIYDDFKD